MGKVGTFAGTLMAIGFAGLAQAVPTDTDITGGLSKAENTCVSPIFLFTSNPPQLCSYSGGEDLFNAVGTGQFRTWMGPLDSGGFYATGTGPDPLTSAGSMPADGKVNLPITGTITIEDNNTSGAGNGGDDSISGTLDIGAGERSVSTSDGSALEGFSSVTHTLPVKVVDSAVGNAQGGYDYVIGSAGFPLLLSSATGDYPSESASLATGSFSPPDLNVWDQANGGNIPVVNMPIPAGGPPFSAGPYTMEIVTYAPTGGNVGPNVGIRTTAVIADHTCTAGDGAGNPLPDCSTDPAVGAPGTWVLAGGEFDNLILRLSTDASNKVVAADAFYTLEYKILSLNANQGKPGSFIGGTLNFTGNADADVPNVVGVSRATAEANIIAAGLAVGTVATTTHLLVPAGNVIRQNPTACTACVVAGSAVDLVVSLGPPLPGGVGGIATSMIVTEVICKAKGKPVVIEVNGASNSWDCESGGLQVNPGENVQMTISGFAK
jgi:hypothetical protein